MKTEQYSETQYKGESRTFVASASMGIESLVRDECAALGFEHIETRNGKVEFRGDLSLIPKANINLRTADRVFLKMGEFKALSFEELFQEIKKIPWEEVIDIDGAFPVSWVSSVKCKLFSKSDIQKIVKKAMVERLKTRYRLDVFPEKGATYAVKIQGDKDIFAVMIDTSGEALHRRGYRKLINEAPLKETMAAALVLLSRWKGATPLLDPMCGTGTIAVEGALIARNIAPGAERNFAAEKWKCIPEEFWINARDEAYSREDREKPVRIYASDSDPEAIRIAGENAGRAGILEDIRFEVRDFEKIAPTENRGAMITNPPYGDRLLDRERAAELYRKLGNTCRQRIPQWSWYVITADEDFEKNFGQKATKNRKLYNGGIKCYFYQYYASGTF
ncbi:MAG: class I SAM-dependent RNA methyltransferase [Fusobacteriaceae bacterium]|jgi:putative N6-adenine-specific DNA methylase|nr:class I SAM-dependent RNA methyltransferase [Fusobacteriaceae bacterium]